MAHIHSVYDTDKHFTIHPSTRVLENQTPEKVCVMQYDHNSERITFDLPAIIESHNILDCNKVEVHYLNIDAQTKEQRKGLYEVDDLQLSPADEAVAICSWLISGNGTQLVGPLYFRVTFKCVTEGNIDYSWSTAIYKGLTVSDGINCTEYVAEQYADILEQWRQELIASGGVSDDRIEAAVEAYMAEHPVPGGGGISSTEKALLLSLFKNAAYTADMSATIAQLETLWSGGDIPDIPDVPVEPDLPDADVSQTGSILSIVSGVTATQNGNVLAIA